ncbi:MAG: IS200/IS605 family element transposase accessory protein TnpB, partial [Candidatus Helarchaeota archaeon]|nr:IS200/IS605 family element transposase accessory protein TnpB [Candidatus Helarchaeota archaeon]
MATKSNRKKLLDSVAGSGFSRRGVIHEKEKKKLAVISHNIRKNKSKKVQKSLKKVTKRSLKEFLKLLDTVGGFFFLPVKIYRKTEQIQIRIVKKKYKKYKDPLSKICHHAKNLYNKANFEIRQRLFLHRKADGSLNKRYLPKYGFLYHLLKNERVYKELPAQTAQQILKVVRQTWKGFFEAHEDYKERPDKYQGEPRIPGYKKKKDSKWLVVFTNQQCRIKNGCLIFPNRVNIPPIRTRIRGKINQVRILPRGNVYVCEIISEKNPKILGLNRKRVLGIDLGLNNTVTCVNNVGLASGIIKGGVIKSINQYYNKLRARYQSIKDKQGIEDETKRLQKLRIKRNNRINNIFHQITRKLVNYCILGNFGKIVIGYNPGWKDKLNLGKRNNQNFVQVPFKKLVDLLKYKGRLVGIKVITVEEWYTSKTSALDLEPIQKRKNYLGKRVHRGL